MMRLNAGLNQKLAERYCPSILVVPIHPCCNWWCTQSHTGPWKKSKTAVGEGDHGWRAFFRRNPESTQVTLGDFSLEASHSLSPAGPSTTPRTACPEISPPHSGQGPFIRDSAQMCHRTARCVHFSPPNRSDLRHISHSAGHVSPFWCKNAAGYFSKRLDFFRFIKL